MNGDERSGHAAQAAELARQFAQHLRHLARYRGLSYVSADPMPIAPLAQSEAQPGDLRVPERSGTAPKAPAKDESLDELQARVKQQSVAQWTPQRKLEYLRDRNVGDCRRCGLCQGRTHIVFGTGSAEARLMFVGEGPGYHEDRKGVPFVGAAGAKLDSWIEAVGLRRESVYIANVVKCRPPDNRDPTPEEVKACAPFLHAQIRAIEPDVLIALGRFAANELLATRSSLGRLRGTVHAYDEPKSGRKVPLVVLPHPAYVLRRDQQAQAGSDGKTENATVLDELRRALASIESARSG